MSLVDWLDWSLTLPEFIYIVFYNQGDTEFIYLAAFAYELDAVEYANRNVWSHLKTFVSKQPLYRNSIYAE